MKNRKKSYTQKIVDALLINKKLSLKDLGKIIKSKPQNISARISEINNSKKKYKDYSIIRVGKHGLSEYEIITKTTKSDDGFRDIYKNSKRIISSVKRRNKKCSSLIQTRNKNDFSKVANEIAVSNGKLQEEVTMAMMPILN